MTDKRGTIQKIADATGVNQATVRRSLRAAGLIAGRGGYDFAEAVNAVNAISDTARVVGHAANGRGEGGSTAAATALGEAKVRRETLQARKLEIENAKAEGRLIDRDAVTATGIHIITTTRTALLTLGNRVAEKVAGKTDVREIARIVDAEVRDVLGALADESKFFAALEADALA
jgi:hypothetical protein